MADKPTSVRAAQALGIFLSTGASGLSLGLSTFVVPRLLESPTPLMLRQWARVLEVGTRTFPVLSTAAAAQYWYLAYRLWGNAGGGSCAARLYLAAGALCMGIVPYTFVAIMPTNRKLRQKLEETKLLGAAEEVEEKGGKEESAKYLVDRWGMLHLGRVAMVAAAGMIGLAVSL